MAEPRVPRIRRAPLPDDAVLVVRGDDVDTMATSLHQAAMFRRRFPDWDRWGLSAFYARNEAEIEDLSVDRLERFPALMCYRVSDLLATGFAIWPTFRTPHVTIAFEGDLADRVAGLLRVPHDRRDNPYHEADGEQER